jgi:hypothetical protein
MTTEADKAKFVNLMQRDIEWLNKQEQTAETAHIDTCLRWLRDDGFELLIDIQRLSSKPAKATGETEKTRLG